MAHRFADRGRCGHEQEVSVPFGGSALDQSPDLATPQAQVDDGVQPLLAIEDDAIHVLPVKHQLSCNQVDLRGENQLGMLSQPWS